MAILHRFKHLIFITLLVLGIAISYANIIDAPFIWDDEEMVVANPLIQQLDQASNIFSAGPFMEKWENIKFYRPIQTLSYAIDYHFWTLDPRGYHLTSIIIHTVSAISIYALFLILGFNPLLAFLTTLIWAIHPIHIESVTYISGRGDALFLLFSITSLLTWILAIRGKKACYIPAVLLWILAILSKENALPLPLIAASYAWIFHSKESSKTWKWNTALALFLVSATVFIRLSIMGNAKGDTLSWIAYSSLTDRILTLPYIAFTYIRLWFTPYPLHMEYHYVADSITDPYLWLGTPALLLLIWAFYKWVPKKEFLFYTSWIILGLLPVYNVALPLASTVREHWFYLSGIAMSALCVIGLQAFLKTQAWAQRKYLLPALTMVIIAALSITTIQRNDNWKSPLTLYEHDLALEPKSFLLHNNAGVEYFRKQDWAKAKAAFKNAIENSPSGGYGIANNNYGVILENEGRLNEAVHQFQVSIVLNQYNLAYMNLGRILIKNNHSKEAIPLLKEGVKANPYSPQLWYLLGIAALSDNNRVLAKETFQKLERLSPNYANTRQILGRL